MLKPVPPLLSIVSPSWNQGAYLEECIRSVGAAADGRIEHLIIDNCSTDQTPEILAKYPHLVVVSEPDSGQSNALNKGFRMAKADWIVWLNVDDFLELGCIGLYLNMVESGDPGFDVFYGHTRFIDDMSNTLRIVYQPQWHPLLLRYGVSLPPTSGTLFRKSVLLDHPLDENYHMIMDSEWFVRNGSRIRVKRQRRVLSAFRITDDNKTSAHVRSGGITPRHAAERERLFSTYGFSYPPESWREVQPKSLAGYLMRKLLRVWVLADKFISKCLPS